MSSTARNSGEIPASLSKRSVPSAVVLLLIALLAGAALRLWHVGQQPQGINPDEALYGYEGWSIQTTGCDYRQTGCPPLYLKGYSTSWDNRTSVLYPYIYSVLWRIAPMTILNVRLVSVVFGWSVIFLIYFLGRLLFASRPLVAGVAALLVAFSPIGISWSRFGHDPITVPFFGALIALSILKAKTKPAWWLMATSVLAISLYSYQPLKIIGPSMFLLTLWYIRPVWTLTQRRWLIGAGAVGLLIATPFLANQIVNWSIVQQQFNSMSVWSVSGRVLILFRPLWNVGLWFWNLLSRPELSLTFVLPAAILGLIAIGRAGRRPLIFALLWLGVALEAIMLTAVPPAGNELQSRGLGLIGPIELFAAVGLVTLYERWRWHWRTLNWQRWGAATTMFSLGLAGVLVSGWINFWRPGFCCFVLGGMEEALAVVNQPAYRGRPVTIQFLTTMQGVNLLWNAKIPPREFMTRPVQWVIYDHGIEQAEYPAAVGRYRICRLDECYQPGDGRLYIVPVDALPSLPTVATFQLHYQRAGWQWKIVDNAPPTR